MPSNLAAGAEEAEGGNGEMEAVAMYVRRVQLVIYTLSVVSETHLQVLFLLLSCPILQH